MRPKRRGRRRPKFKDDFKAFKHLTDLARLTAEGREWTKMFCLDHVALTTENPEEKITHDC